MSVALLSKNKIGFIDGSLVAPPTDDVTYSQWQRCNTMVMAWIHKSICESIAKSILWIESARDAWIDLRDQFAQCDIFRISDLQEEIYKIHQGERSVTEFFTQMKMLWDELENLKSLLSCECLPSCTCGAKTKMRSYRDRDHVIRFLKGLNDQYAAIRSQIMMIDPFPNVNKVFSMVVQQERQFRSGTSDETISQPFVAFNNSGGNDRGRGNFNQSFGRYGRGRGRSNAGRGVSGNSICTHCGRTNHTIETCYQLHGYPQGFRSRNTDTQHNSNNVVNATSDEKSSNVHNQQTDVVTPRFSHEQYHQLISLLQNLVNQPTHAANISHVSHSNTIKPCILHGHWIIDIGATDDISYLISSFSSIHKIDNIAIVLPDGSRVMSSHSGSVVLSSTLTLSYVLFVPEFRVNLISVTKLVPSQVMIGTAEEKNGLYVIVHDKGTYQNSLAFLFELRELNSLAPIYT
ncbi:uncharacterized protein LOC133316542 [Gastrolobium bilobum]|uniref:uncharacterized protein LOC133316542 n=1 Tax=Gastrolobium bilobum TaxID=150636 RepID=UPI002AB12A11|nr:uncharacterized protein LOC133316542 [Gastrolobium bilobum]